MFGLNRYTWGIAAGIAGTLFIGYCIYFDKKRRSDPEYKKKIRNKRRNQQKANTKSGMPNLNDRKALEQYFMSELQLGETLIAKGDFENGVEHLANAILICGQPTALLQVMQTSLPAQVFAMLIMKMQELGNRAAAGESIGGAKIVAANTMGMAPLSTENTTETLLIDDLE